MVEFHTKLGREELLALNKFHLLKKKSYVVIGFMIVFFCLGVTLFFAADDVVEKIFSIIFMIGFGIGFPVLCYMFMRFMLWLQFRSAKYLSDDNIVKFRIDESNINIITDKIDMKTTTDLKWNLVHRAFETKSHFFIYLSNMQSYIIPKKSIFTGTNEELSTLLEKSLVKNFRKKF